MASGGVTIRSITSTLVDIGEHTGIAYPNNRPHHDITFVAVAWNEEVRAPDLLALAREWFSHMVIGVQESTDGTLHIARQFANRPTDRVIEHPHYGFGDKSMPELVKAAETPWVFVVAFDELPDAELLKCLRSATALADSIRVDAWWVSFASFVDGIEYTEQHGHVRLFKRSLGWPETLHSRPTGTNEAWWPYGKIIHERSLDEMIRDYLRYYRLGRGNRGWDAHNLLMIHDACASVAKEKGWPYVQLHDWWPEVARIAFTKEELNARSECGPSQRPRRHRGQRAGGDG